MQHYIQFLPEARALLAAIILTSRALLVIRAVHPSGRIPAKPDAAASAPAPAAPTTSASMDGATSEARSKRMSRIVHLTSQAAQTAAAGLVLLEWLNKIGLV